MPTQSQIELSPEILREIEVAKIRFFVGNAPRAGITLLFVCATLAVIYRRIAPLDQSIAWMIFVSVLVSGRTVVAHRLLKLPESTDPFYRYGRWTVYLTVLLGIQWIVPMALWFPDADSRTQGITLLVITCSIFGALISTAVHMTAFATYAVSTLGATYFGLQFSPERGNATFIALSTAATVFAFLSARAFQSVFKEAVLVRSENANLVRELKTSHDALVLADKARSRFVASVCHDIRQPLTALELLAHQAANTNDIAKKAEIVVKIRHSSSSLTEFVSSVLDVAKYEAGAIQPQLEPVSVSNLFGEIRREFEPLANQRSLALQFTVDERWLLLDPVLLKQATANLVDNAIKYTTAGSVSVLARFGGEALEVVVADTGCGIPHEIRGDVFKAYFRGNSVGSTNALGWGLGLTIASRSVNAMGGSLELDDQVEPTGATFRFRIPTLLAPTAPAAVAADTERGLDSSLRVVVLDDDEKIVDALVSTLLALGHDAIGFVSTADAIDVVSDNRDSIDLVVVDYRLNDTLDGLDVLRKVREMDASIQGVLMTADLASAAKESAEALGCGFLRKPFYEHELKARIAQLAIARKHYLAAPETRIDSADHAQN